ncbi:hypothetical protein HanXRQr2_Chr14g0642061 [Helianthus annuus]|uniref:Uncharacterized protein n=2 Tax=Helianthus annuus TaxID=4232 RepID=A0A9K3H6C8_HELAN|nr:hypothetical protein HanXRQr2_Chr14g0642061 [Helianthus annuus]KAJ0485602.1 hypothetical protein HanHA89_Chr14g0570161 [Helianthus annuus]KAJ0656154.1 hypothetical protein HanLR1_Chr14g0532551 [Helianthus annuus]KAJ0840206.1 hypothetical protein HanPSC8_Chr14g0615911 [Helianthus annuus]
MFRSMSTRKVHRGYEQLISEPTIDDQSSEAKMLRSTTLPANFFGEPPVKFIEKQVKKASKIHPFFSMFERRSGKKKATAKPEFSRYMQYLKEGGIWDANSIKPVIY